MSTTTTTMVDARQIDSATICEIIDMLPSDRAQAVATLVIALATVMVATDTTDDSVTAALRQTLDHVRRKTSMHLS